MTMAHPAKRRRLDTPLSQFSDDDEIALFEDDSEALEPEVRDRIAARNRFKSVLEGIFEKYGRDFTGVGDEIDLRTGKLVVDNGHLKRMEDEGDVGGRLGSSEDELDLDDDSDGSLLDGTNLGPQDEQEWDEQPLESLNFDSIVKQRSQAIEKSKTKLLPQVQDPKWQIPDLPSIKFGLESNHESQAQAAAQNLGLPDPRNAKSPARSLWTHVRSSKSYKRMPLHPSRRQNIWHGSSKDQENGMSGRTKTVRPQEVYDSNVSHTQVHDFKSGPPQTLDPKTLIVIGAEKRTMHKEATALLARTGEWSVSEEQQLIRYRLNTSLSYTALASKFSGKTVDMVKHRWRYLKRKIIELPASTTTRITTSFREVGTHRGSEKLPGTRGETYNLGKAKKDHPGTSNRAEPHDLLPHLQSEAVKHLSSEKGQQSCDESLQHSKDQMACAINTQQQVIGYNLSSNIPSENDGQRDELHYPLQVFPCSKNATGSPSLLSEQQQLSNDGWNTFPLADQMQTVDNDENGEDLDQMWCAFAEDFNATWQQDHTPEALDSPFLVPYGPIGFKRPLVLDQNNSHALQGIQVTQSGDAISRCQNSPQPDNIIATEADLLRIGFDGDESRTASSAFDLMTLASDIGIETSYTPDSSRTLPQLPCSLHPSNNGHVATCHTYSMQQRSTREAANQYHTTTENSDARVILRSTIRDTQDQSSPIVMGSSDCSLGHPCQISEPVLPHANEPLNLLFKEITEPLQKSSSLSTRLMTSLTRESSPLSSLSSSDSRIARPSDLSSSQSKKDIKLVELHEAAMDFSESVLEGQPSAVITEETEHIDPQLLNPHTNMDQAVALPKTPPCQSRASTQPPMTPVMVVKLAKMNMESSYVSPKNPRQILKHERKTPRKNTTTILDVMKEVDDDLRSGCDSFEKSSNLVELMARRRQTNKHTPAESVQAVHRTTNVRRPSQPVVCHSKIVKPNLPLSKRERKVFKPNAQQIQETANSLFSTSRQFSKSTARGADKSSLSRQRGVARPEEPASFEKTLNYAAFKDNNVVSVEGKDLPHNTREMTPIDTYDYMLADPWPADPLSTDTMQGIRKAPQSKDERYSKHKITEVALRCHSQCSTLSSTSALSEVDVFNLEVGKRPQIPKQMKNSGDTNLERKLKPPLLAQSLVMSKSEPYPVSKKRQTTEQKPHAVMAVQSIEPKSAATLPSKNNHRFSLPQSSDHLVSDRLLETPRKPSPSRKPKDVLLEFGKGRPLTRANLLSQDEIPSTSQETVLSFLSSQATQLSRPTPSLKPSRLARQSRARSVSSTIACRVKGVRCERILCSNCTPRVVSQEEVDF